MKTPVKQTKDGISISVHAQPGASKTVCAGLLGENLRIRVAARPIEGEANKELCRFLAEYFGVPKSAVQVSRGLSARVKQVVVNGDSATLFERAQQLLSPS